MRVLVTGGAGFLGINLIRHLLQKGYQVRCLDIAAFDYPEKDRVEVVTGDIRRQEDVERAMSGVDLVVHCAAALPLYTEAEIMSTDVEGTRNILRSALRRGVRRVVHISSTAVYGIPDHHPLYEEDGLDGVGPYGKAKILAEEECLQARAKGLIVTIIRPKSFIGPERLGVFAMLYEWADEGHGFPMVGRGHNRYQLLDVEDLCEAIYLCLAGDAAVVNDVFNIGAKEFTTMKEDFQAVLDKAGHGKKIHGFPAWPLIQTLRVLEFFRLSPLYKWVYETAHKDSFVSIEKAEKLLNWHPRYSNKDALLRNYQWYLDNRHTFAGKSGVSHRVPWKQGVLSLVKKFF